MDPPNKDLIQISGDKAEITRRINAFMDRKRQEVNRINVRDYCALMQDSRTSCARTDAVYVPYYGSKSHIKVKRVQNDYGPQTRSLPEKTERSRGDSCGLQERLQTLEGHLLPEHDEDEVLTLDSINKRLKRLEERVLELEGISPEYIAIGQSMPISSQNNTKDVKLPNTRADASMQSVDVQIKQLKERLLLKKLT